MINRFIRALAAAGAEVDSRNVADVLWLAHYLTPGGTQSGPTERAKASLYARDEAEQSTPNITTAPDPNRKQATRDERSVPVYVTSPGDVGDQTVRASPLRVPAVPALPKVIEIGRSLRSLKRRRASATRSNLDLEATAEQFADTRVLAPVMKPAMEHWFEVALVFDGSPSMDIWRETNRELYRLLTLHGAFRDVRCWTLSADADEVMLVSESGLKQDWRELIDPAARRLMLLLTDCTGKHWDHAPVWKMLAGWGKSSLAALIQVLPERLWVNTALGSASASASSRLPGVPNAKLEVEHPWWEARGRPSEIAVPVITLKPAAMAVWSNVLMGGKAAVPATMAGVRETHGSPSDVVVKIGPEERVRQFKALVSPTAYQLAVYLSAVPLTLPVMRLVQHTMLGPKSDLSHLAEFFLGGLIERTTPADAPVRPDQVTYDFHRGVRRLLENSMTRSATLRVLQAVSHHLEEHYGAPLDFQALVPSAQGSYQLPAYAIPFATIGTRLLERFGYAAGLNEGPLYPRKPPLERPIPQPVEPEGTMHNLPFSPNPLFTGREAELEALRRGLQERVEVAVTKTVAVHGLGGVGKTQLVVQYAWKHLREFDAVLWVKADSPEVLDSGLAALASLLRLPEAGDRDQAVQIKAVLGWLQGHERWLLIADNADTDEAARAVSDRFFSPTLGGAVLITSRLGRWPVNVRHLSLNVLSREDAVRYLLDRVARSRHNAGGETAARSLAQELGDLPLALEQAAAFIIEVRWTFDKYREQLGKARPELLGYVAVGGTRYPASVAKTWSNTLDQLSPLARSLLRIAAWFAPDAIPRSVFSAERNILAEALDEEVTVSDLAIEKALSELDRFSLVRLTSETVSIHRLLQAVEQDVLGDEGRKRWLLYAVRLFNAFAPEQPDDVRTWGVWMALASHAETLLEHAERQGIDALPIALAANQLGLFLYARAAYAQGEPLLERALAIREKALGPEHPAVATSLNNLALLYASQGQYAKAEPLCQRALAIDEKSYGPDHPNVAIRLNNLAQLLQATNRLQEAEPLMRRALGIDEKSYGPDHPRVATDLNNLAQLLQATNRLQEAEPLMRRALGMDEKSYGPDHPRVATDLNNLAQLLQATNRLQEAEPLMRRALGIDEKSYGPDHPDVARDLNNLALLLKATNRLQEAEPLMRRALGMDEKSYGPDHPRVATDLNNLAQLLQATNRLQEAEPLMRQVLRILAEFDRRTGLEHPHFRAFINNYDRMLAAMGLSEAEILARVRSAIEGEPDESA